MLEAVLEALDISYADWLEEKITADHAAIIDKNN